MEKAWRIATVSQNEIADQADISVAQNDPADTPKLEELLKGLHPVAKLMLERRRLTDTGKISEFLLPSWENGIHDPFLFSQMRQAVDRLFAAVVKGERIVVHGDYDADGVCGSVVLAETIKMLAKEIHGSTRPAQAIPDGETYVAESPLEKGDTGSDDRFFPVLTRERNGSALDIYIPHREKEGYGLNLESVNLIADSGADLLITVDCGISNVKEIAAARERGMDAIVVDHHQFGEILPDAILIHPKLPGEIYPFKDLAAVGVAWKFASALIAEGRTRGLGVPAGYEKWLLDLVSIATVTDIVPLVGENRVLETYGLVVLNKLRRPGFKALIDVANWKRGVLDSETVGFVIGPRINAAGRMEHAYQAVDLLLEENPEQAATKANALEAINRNRQKATESLMKDADGMATLPENHSLHIAWLADWPPALVGLAAGRYADRLGKPAVFIGKFGDAWIGSGRSIPGYDITAALRDVGDGLLARFGGHAQACGFTILSDEHVPVFAEALRAHAMRSLNGQALTPSLILEAELRLSDLDDSLLATLEKFQPFGEANPRPLFMSSKLTVVEMKMVGAAQNHVRCVLQDALGAKGKFMGFYRSDLSDMLKPGACVDVAYEVSASVFNGRREVQCKLVDAKPSR